MKSEGAIRQKLKQVRFRYAKRELDASLTRTSSTCEHNVLLEVPGVGSVGACRLEAGVVCDAARDIDLAQDCTTYACRYSKEVLKETLSVALDAPIPEVAAKYPDAAALMWVLTDENPTDTTPEPMLDPFGEAAVSAGTLLGVPVWVRSPVDGETLTNSLNDLMARETQLRALVALKEGLNQVLRDELATVHADVSSVRAEFLLTKSALASLESDLKGRVQELEDALQRVTDERDALLARNNLPFWSPSRWAK
jgi:hypothetical protein